MRRSGWAITLCLAFASSGRAAILEFGDEDLLNTGTYGSDPKAGATLEGLAPGVVTFASQQFGHGFPFSPTAGDFLGTDRIFVGSVQTAAHDGYAGSASRLNGPQILSLNYGSLVSAGDAIATFTLGIAADDFQQAVFGQPFTASINGVVNPTLTSVLNSLSQTGPITRFFTIGLDPASLLPTNVLTLSIDQGGDGGDGWAVDFLTVGVTTRAVPEPGAFGLLALGAAGLGLAARRRRAA